MAQNNKFLLVNPNRYTSPPVIPIGIEYLAHSCHKHGMETEVLDLCFSENPDDELRKALSDIRPDAVCFSVRNHDSVLYPDTEYFLPEIKKYIKNVKERSNAPVIIGGSALKTDPEGIMDYLGADFGITGPGEISLPSLLKLSPSAIQGNKIIQGKLLDRKKTIWRFNPIRAALIDYSPYIEKGGIVGFETHKGCSSNCMYCIEACSDVTFREPCDVVHELLQLTRRGFDHFHLCDPEFNEDIAFCKELLSLMVSENFSIKWALYMKPGGCDETLFTLLKRSGAYLITLTVDTYKKPAEYWNCIGKIVTFANECGIRVSIDLLSGFPDESANTLRRYLDKLRNMNPHEIVINTYIRLYRHLPITKLIENNTNLMKYLINKGDTSYLSPVFFNNIGIQQIKDIIGNDPLFRIAGQDNIVNYQTIQA